jgi:hypothetical protein
VFNVFQLLKLTYVTFMGNILIIINGKSRNSVVKTFEGSLKMLFQLSSMRKNVDQNNE